MSTRTRIARWPSLALSRREERRQGYRIDPAFQSRFRTLMLGFSVAVLGMTALLVAAVLHVVEHPESVPASPWVPGGLLALAVAIGGAVFYLSERLSHRYCGPAHRIAATLRAVARGERPQPITLRRGDELQELAAALNDTLRRLGAPDEER